MRYALLAAAALSAACATTSPAPAPATPAATRAGLPFIEDDFPRALAEAKAADKPLFVDAWAPW